MDSPGMGVGSPRLARKASNLPPPSLSALQIKTLGLEEDDPEQIFEIHSKEGAGAFGRVFCASYRKNPSKLAALKVIPVALEAGQRGEDIENVRREIQFLRECDHPNVVAFFGAYYKDNALWVAMEYCGGGSVGDVSRRRKLEEDEIAVIMRGALQGLAYLHARKKIHRDIKGGNILLTSQGDVKIADFGVSAQLKDTMSRRGTFVGTPYWMSPEMIQDNDYDYKSDIWSLGITMIELADQKPPLFDEHPMRVLIQIPRNPSPSVKNPQLWTSLFTGFLQFCLQKDPTERPSALECLEHGFIKRVAAVEHVVARPSVVVVPESTMGGEEQHVEQEEKAPAGAPVAVEQVPAVLAPVVKAAMAGEEVDAEADDATLKASAARPSKPPARAPQPQPQPQPQPAAPVEAVVAVALPVEQAAPVKLPEQGGGDDGDDGGLRTPRSSESDAHEVDESLELSQVSDAVTSSQSGLNSDGADHQDEDEGDDEGEEYFTSATGARVPHTRSDDASSKGFAFRHHGADDELSVDDSFELPAMAVISKIHAATANTLAAGQSLRLQLHTSHHLQHQQLPLALQSAASPIRRPSAKSSKTSSPTFVDSPRAGAISTAASLATTTATTTSAAPLPRRDLNSFSHATAMSPQPSHSPRRSGGDEAAKGWTNPLADLTGFSSSSSSHDRVNTLLSSLSASSSSFRFSLPPPPSTGPSDSPPSLRLSLNLSSQQTPQDAVASSSHFIGTPFRVSHPLCVKYNTLDAKFEGAPANTSEWLALHKQFGIPLAQMRRRTNAPHATDPPALIQMLHRELVQRDGLEAKYIYRVSPDTNEISHSKQAINQGKFEAASVRDPHVFASLIKHWLRELPSALCGRLTREDLANCISFCVAVSASTAGSKEETPLVFARPFQEIHAYVATKVLVKLPAQERGVLLWLVDHMLEIMAKTLRNGMTASSLAVVMAPNVYRWASTTPQDASAIATQVATLLRVLLAWRKRCRDGADGDAGSDRPATVMEATPSRSGGSSLSRRASEATQSTLASSLRGSTVSGLLRRSSININSMATASTSSSSPWVGSSSISSSASHHFVNVGLSVPDGDGRVGSGSELPPPTTSGSIQHSVDTLLLSIVDDLWNELPWSLSLDEKPPIIKVLHLQFQTQLLTTIEQKATHAHQRQWATQTREQLRRCSPPASATATASATAPGLLPLAVRKWTRWIHAALNLDSFIKLLQQTRHAQGKLEKKTATNKKATRTHWMSPQEALTIHHRLALAEAAGSYDLDPEEPAMTKNPQKKESPLDPVMLDGAATLVAATPHTRQAAAALPPLVEDVAQMAQQEPLVSHLLTMMSGQQMRKYHLKKQHLQLMEKVKYEMIASMGA